MSLRRPGFLIAIFLPISLLPAITVHAQLDSVIKKNHLLFLPVIARSIETSWSFGTAVSGTFHINKKDSAVRTSNVQGLVLYSLKKQFIAAINGTVYLPGEKFI